MVTAPLSEVTTAFGARVRARRQELGYSQEQLAEASGLHWTYVSQTERGHRNVSLHILVRLADALTLDAGELVAGLHAPAVTSGGE